MTPRSVTDEEYGKLCRRIDEVKRRVKEGPLDYKRTMNKLQEMIEGGIGVSYSGDGRLGGMWLL